jgi:HD-like signal output (HDOD) protein
MTGRRTTASIGKAKKIRFIAEKIIALPTLPTVTAKMMELVDDPGTTARALARLIEGDPVLTAKILKLANSPYHGFQHEVGTVSLAIAVVGFDAVKDMGLSVSVMDAFKDPADDRYFDLSGFWAHAVGVGLGSRFLARAHCPACAAGAFTAGLLHDLGKVVINQYLHDDFTEIMERVHEDGVDLLEAETLVLDTTHDRIGGWLAEKWYMPYSIVEAIEYHHSPYLSKNHRPLAAMVKLADFLARRARVGVSGNKKDPELSPEDADYYATLGIDVSPKGIQKLTGDFPARDERPRSFTDIIKETSWNS